MAEELSYVNVTSYSIPRSRTGGILSRLVSRKIRHLPGPTDPSAGSIRSEFAQSAPINVAHGSDPSVTVRRRRQIIKIEENSFKELIEMYHADQPV